MADEIDQISEFMNRFAETSDKTNRTLINLTKTVSDLVAVEKKQKERMRELNAGARERIILYKEMKAKEGDLAKVQKDHTKNISEQVSAYKKASMAYHKHMALVERINKQIKMQTDGYTKLKTGLSMAAKGYSKLTQGVRSLWGLFGKLTAGLGLQAVGFTNLIQSGLKYDETLHGLSRTQQVAGREVFSMAKALRKVEQSTILSRQQFAELASAIQDMYVGLKPTMSEMADFAVLLQKQFGPSVDGIKNASKDLLSIQSKFPALFTRMISLTEQRAKATNELSGAEKVAAEESIALEQASIAIQLRRMDVSQKVEESFLQLTTERTEAQKKLMEFNERSAKLNQELQNAQLDLYEKFKPILLDITKLTIKAVDAFGKNLPAIIKFVKVLASFKVASAGVNSVATAVGVLNPALGLTLGILGNIAAGFAAWKWGPKAIDEISSKLKGLSTTDTDIGLRMNFDEEKVKDIGKLEDKLREKYNKSWQANKGNEKTLQEQKKLHLGIIATLSVEAKAVENVNLKHRAIVETVKSQLQLLGQVATSLDQQISSMSEFGGISRGALSSLVKIKKAAAEVTLKEMNSGIKTALAELDKLASPKGISLEIPSGLTEPLSKANYLLLQLTKLQKEYIGDEENVNKIKERRLNLDKEIGAYAAAGAESTKAFFEELEAPMKRMENFTSIYSQRLDEQRRLMEAAQFGLGASVEMMQRQVDLAYRQMKVYEQTDALMSERVRQEAELSHVQMSRLKAAAMQGDAEDFIRGTLGKEGVEAQKLLGYAYKHQDISMKIMKQQSKIYELTKDIREGYLDSMREMAVNTKEFTKIIGTQEMGVDQLLSSVKAVTGEWTNTMGLGGMLKPGAASVASRSQLTGQYLQGGAGIQFQGAAAQELRNQDIYRYQEYADQFRAMQQGGGKTPTAGFAGVQGGQNYIDPQRSAEIMGKSVEDGVYKGGYEGNYQAIVDVAPALGAIIAEATNVRGAATPGMEKPGAWNPKTLMNTFASYLQGSKAVAPARGGGWTPTPDALQVPSANMENSQVKQLISVIHRLKEAQAAVVDQRVRSRYQASNDKYWAQRGGGRSGGSRSGGMRLAPTLESPLDVKQQQDEVRRGYLRAKQQFKIRQEEGDRLATVEKGKTRFVVASIDREIYSIKSSMGKQKGLYDEAIKKRKDLMGVNVVGKQAELEGLENESKVAKEKYHKESLYIRKRHVDIQARLILPGETKRKKIGAYHRGLEIKLWEDVQKQEGARQEKVGALRKELADIEKAKAEMASLQDQRKVLMEIEDEAVRSREDDKISALVKMGALEKKAAQSAEAEKMLVEGFEQKFKAIAVNSEKNIEARKKTILSGGGGGFAGPSKLGAGGIRRMGGFESRFGSGIAPLGGNGVLSMGTTRERVRKMVEQKNKDEAEKSKGKMSLSKAEERISTQAMKQLYGFDTDKAVATVIVKFDEGLKLAVDNASNMAVELQSLTG